MSTLSSANIMDGNLVLKECTHRIKIKYSMHQYSIHLHNLGNWLIMGEISKNINTEISVFGQAKGQPFHFLQYHSINSKSAIYGELSFQGREYPDFFVANPKRGQQRQVRVTNPKA